MNGIVHASPNMRYWLAGHGNGTAMRQRLLSLLTWLALPVYVWQGLGVRRRTTRMLPAGRPWSIIHNCAEAVSTRI